MISGWSPSFTDQQLLTLSVGTLTVVDRWFGRGTNVQRTIVLGGHFSGGTVVLGGQLSGGKFVQGNTCPTTVQGTNVGGTLVRGKNITTPYPLSLILNLYPLSLIPYPHSLSLITTTRFFSPSTVPFKKFMWGVFLSLILLTPNPSHKTGVQQSFTHLLCSWLAFNHNLLTMTA